jgi:hypothetical protein
MQRKFIVAITSIAASATFLTACGKKEEAPPPPPPVAEEPKPAAPAGADPKQFLTQPLAIDIYSADPSRSQRQDTSIRHTTTTRAFRAMISATSTR